MTVSRGAAVLYLIGATLFAVPGAIVVGWVMLINFVFEDDVCHGIYWCDYNGYAFLGLIPLSFGLWLGDRGLERWRRNE